MTSPYLDRPLVPLAVVLPRMLDQIEAQLADEKLVAAEEERLSPRRIDPRAARAAADRLARQDQPSALDTGTAPGVSVGADDMVPLGR